MANLYYSRTYSFDEHALARGGDVRAELDALVSGFDYLPAPTRLQQGRATLCTVHASTTANAIALNMHMAPPSIQDGMEVAFIPTLANTGAVTVNVDGLGAIAVKDANDAALTSGAIIVGIPLILKYSATKTAFYIVGANPAYAVNAAASATNAANSASAAATSATNAASSATSASGSASAAATSATNASNSATSASTSAISATTQAGNAASSASSANTSATNAANSSISAGASASNAASSATSASGSAATATTQASNASTSATNASISEANSLASKNAAATSEANAALYASQALALTPDSPIRLNSKIVSTDFIVDSAYNAISSGPIEIAENITVTINSNSTWSLV